MSFTRREFVVSSSVLASGLALSGRSLAQVAAVPGPLTVGVVLERMKGHLGVPWRTPTVDNVLAGTNESP